MKSLPLAGAVAMCAVLLFTGCAKKSTEQTTSGSTTTDTTQTAGATPAADAAATPAAAGDASVSSSSGNGANGAYIDIPVYPAAAEAKEQAVSASGNGSSVTMHVYTSKDDPKRVSEWYKSHLPASWKNGIITVGGKTNGTFAGEYADGDQSVLVTNQDDGSSRIQLATKHGK